MARKAQKQKSSPLNDILVTVALVANNDREILDKKIKEIFKILVENYRCFEILIVDNSSLDGSDLVIKKLQEKLPNVRLLVLSRSYHLEIAYSAALDNSIGDYVVLIDIISDPPDLIPKLIAKAAAGSDVVVAEREDRKSDTLGEQIFAHMFYFLTGKILGFKFSSSASYYRVLSRRAVNSVIKIKSKNRYLKYFTMLVGFKDATVPYQKLPRARPVAGSSKKNKRRFMSSIAFAIDILISNSSLPLRIASVVGALAAFASLAFLGYVLIIALIKKHLAEGWLTSSVVNGTMFFLMFVVLAIMSEYIARILNETKDQPLYFVAEESNSIVSNISEKEKINVVE
jgi:polyisoprenyl-phosphate glycosyltransferase